MDLPETLISLLYQPSTCYIATTMPDGSPQLTQTWVRGRVIDITAEGGAEHIEKLAQKYLGGSYPWSRGGGREQVRLILTISAERIHGLG